MAGGARIERRVACGSVLLALVVLAVATGCGGGKAKALGCAPPVGPSDTAAHSQDLVTKNVACDVGRKVALACKQFTYGNHGTCSAAGYQWSCTSTWPSGSVSPQECVAGSRSVSITWLD